MKYTLLGSLAFSIGLPAALSAATLRPGVPIYLSASEPGPVRRAVRDLQRDLRKVLGVESPVTDKIDPAGGPPSIFVLGPSSGPAALRRADVTGREAHAVFARGPHVVLQGADMRGAVYAIYTFSERFLGVPPLWFWASREPERKPSIEVPADTALMFPPAYVRWRAWFPNDEDLLTPWRARSPENYEAFVETMLRLKMNTLEGGMMDPPSFDEPYRIGRQAALARDRGLAVTGHHMLIFGSSYRHWEDYWTKIRRREPPALRVGNVEALEDFWRYHVEAGVKAGLEMIWLIGFRGNRDIPFWHTFPDAPKTDPARARVIQDMMARQVALLKKATGRSAPPMRVTLYNENSDFFAQNLLRPPDEPSLIWTFVAARRDHYPAADVLGFRNDARRPVGYYMNFQFTSSGAHLAQAEGPWKMERNFRMVDAISGRPLEFSVVNAGNIREFVFELSANARMMWDFGGFQADAFLDEFCRTYFGSRHAAAAADLYRRYYQSFWTPKKPDIPGFERQYVFQDMRYARAIEMLLAQLQKGRDPNPLTDRGMDAGGRYFRIVPEDNGVSTQLEAVAKAAAECAAKFGAVATAAAALRDGLPEYARPLFTDNLVAPSRFLAELNRTLGAVAAAVDALPDRSVSAAALRRTGMSADAMKAALSGTTGGRFAGWYDSDRLFGVDNLRARIRKAAAEMERR